MLGDDDAGLDEKLAEVTVVIPSKIGVSPGIARSAGDDEKLGRPLGDVTDNGVL